MGEIWPKKKSAGRRSIIEVSVPVRDMDDSIVDRAADRRGQEPTADEGSDADAALEETVPAGLHNGSFKRLQHSSPLCQQGSVLPAPLRPVVGGVLGEVDRPAVATQPPAC